MNMEINRKESLNLVLLCVVVALTVASPAFSAGDQTFSVATTKILAWMSGTFGLLISLLALATALIGAVTGKLMLLVSAVGVALAFYVGPGVIQGFFNATL